MEKYLDLKNNSNYSELQYAANIIKNGGIVLFPTETVYGIGANAFNEDAVKKIFLAKGRDFNNPINLLVSDNSMIESVADNITPLEYKLINTFFPGPFTIILHKKKNIPDIVTAGLNFVGVRMPNGEIARKLVEFAEVPIAAPSANLSGKTCGTDFDSLYKDFYNKVDYLIDNGNSTIGIESTIVKVIDEIPHILRPGSITCEQIMEVSKTQVIKDYENNAISNLPSKNLDHYKLNNNSTLVYTDKNEILINKILDIAEKYANPVILCLENNIDKYSKYNVINMGKDLTQFAKNLFINLRKADKMNPDIIIIEGIKPAGIGEAIMNRLMKSCSNNFILY